MTTKFGNPTTEPLKNKGNLSEEELEVEKLINEEVDNLKINSIDCLDNGLKIESLNINIDDDLSNLEEIYIDNVDPNEIKELEPLKMNEDKNKIKTVYIDTTDKSNNPKKTQPTFNETDIEINNSESEYDNYRNKKYSKKDYSFFNE